MDTRKELEDELIAILGAARELSPDTDKHLADVYLRQIDAAVLRRPWTRQEGRVRPRASSISLSSLAIIAGIEGVIMFFFDEWMKGYLGVGPFSSDNSPMNTVFIALWIVQVSVTAVLPRVLPLVTRYPAHGRADKIHEM